MKLRIASDIHTEFFSAYEIPEMVPVILPSMPDDKDTILILAGDIGSMNAQESLVGFMDEVCPRFKGVLYTTGNHEYYGGDIASSVETISDLLKHHKNLFFSNNGRSIIDGKRFLMTTLWTDYNGAGPGQMLEAKLRMNDYRYIKYDGKYVRPEDLLTLHRAYLENIKDDIKEGDIVITHHLPSFKSVDPEFKTSRVNGAYATDLEYIILDKKPSLWIHGHTHATCDYMIGSTRVLCNPRGYGNQYKKNGYNATLTFEV